MEDVIAAFLRAELPEARAVRVEGLRLVAGGYSRETFAVDCLIEHAGGRQERLPLILRRDPPPETAILHNSRLVEHRLLNRLAERTALPVSRSLYLDAEGRAFARPAMLLERMAGSSDLTALFGGADADQLEAVATDLCERLAQLHTTPIEVLDPDGELGDPRGVGIDTSSWQAYMDSMLDYFARNYEAIAFDPFPLFFDAYCSLRNRMPAPVPLAFTHGDFQMSNFLYRDGKVTAIIDWENAHIGDPREDLGWLAQMQIFTGIDLMGAVKRDGGFLGYYSKLTGIPVTAADVHFFQMFTASALGAPIVAAVKRRLDGVHKEFLHLYLIQAVIGSEPVFAAIMGYPPPEGAA